jgi:hypothetical protein
MKDMPAAKVPAVSWASWVRSRAGELVMALLLFYAVIQFSERLNEREQSMVPAESWFRVNEVYVPDHVTGSNPPVIYDRDVVEGFRGFYVVEVQRQLDNGLWWSACSGSGVSDYEPGEAIPDNVVTWEWYVSRPCAVPPGIYRLRSSWEMKRPDWSVKSLVNLSNEFRVLAPGEATSHPTPATTDAPGVFPPARKEGN